MTFIKVLSCGVEKESRLLIIQAEGFTRCFPLSNVLWYEFGEAK